MIVAGFGFRKTASVHSLQDALAQTTGPAPQAVATAADKTDSPAFKALAEDLELPMIAVEPDPLTQRATVTQSAASLAARGTGSVAEAAALAAAGPKATLLAPRVVSRDGMATCALAEGETE